MGIELRRKGKIKKSNKVHKKNEKDVGRSRSSISKSIGENKETSRQ